MPPRGKGRAVPSGSLEASERIAARAKQQLHELEAGDEEATGEFDGSDELPGFRDYSGMALKRDHANRPLWVCPNGSIFLEASSSLYAPAYDFLVAIAEPVARPEFVHEYRVTPNSLYAAVSVAIDPEDIVGVLDKLSKVTLPGSVRTFIMNCTQNYGRAKLVLRQNRHHVESRDARALRELLSCEGIKEARDDSAGDDFGDAGASSLFAPDGASGFAVGEAQPEAAANRAYLELAAELEDDDEENEEEEDTPRRKEKEEVKTNQTVSFRLKAGTAQEVKRIAAKDLDFPLQEEYDFRHDRTNATLPIDLRPSTQIRNYQEKSLSKMFGNGRARSGIIVLPCGAGKTLTAIVAAATVKRWTLVLCTNATAVHQWSSQFQLWTTIDPNRISIFTADRKDELHADCGILITTYHMVSFSGKRSAEGERLIDQVRGKEWGLMLLDEVHVVPAKIFRKVLAVCNAHCKLGLTATLVREDDLITDLNFLIGPKLYEANWMDLTQAGHLANVQCVEVWCPMTAAFYREYLHSGGAGDVKMFGTTNNNQTKKRRRTNDDEEEDDLKEEEEEEEEEFAGVSSSLVAARKDKHSSNAPLGRKSRQRQLLYVLNPVKFRRCEYLVDYHEKRGDKIIVFSDDVFALLWYAKKLERPAIYGATKEAERQSILSQFRFNAVVNTVFLSKVGDVAIDLPEANVIIQISSHFGSRRQEAQRLGRILRPKPNADGSEGFNAIFYTLVSQDTSEMYYSAKRQQYLIDQGYTFKVVTDIPSLDRDSKVQTPQEELDLLNDVLCAQWEKDQEAEEKALTKAANDDIGMAAINGGQGGLQKTQITMAKFSGGQGLTYLEYNANLDLGNGKNPKKQHSLFKARNATKKAKPIFS